MLSIENKSEALCPCKLSSAVNSDERSDPVAVGGIQNPSFSIRDYVCSSRSKDIRKNWPFTQKVLHLCLKHGIKDILPPFKPPDLVRAQSCKKEANSEHQFACSGPGSQDNIDILVADAPRSINSESCSPSNELVVNKSKQKGFQSLVDGEVNHHEVEINSIVTTCHQNEITAACTSKLPRSVHVSEKGDSEAPSELEVTERPLPKKLETSEKKCGLVVKLASVSEITRAEDIVSTSSTVLDPMASKVCPVCKTFASTSNTTLNAHIDQCLTSDKNTKSPEISFSKFKVKARKKRLMADIYTTAPHCTLEDLDRRNGTTWALDLAVVPPTAQANMETKRPRLLPMCTGADANDGEVYVDSNGIKIRILSKFSNAPALMSKEKLMSKKCLKKSCLAGKKKRFGPKYMIMKPHSKNLTLLKISEEEVQEKLGEICKENSFQEKEELPSQILNAQEEQVEGSKASTLRQWICSKRSDLVKKLDNKDIHGNSDTSMPCQLEPVNLAQSHVLKLSRSSEHSNSSLKAKNVDVLSKTSHIFNKGKKSPASRRMLKLSRLGGSVIWSPGNEREEVCRSSSPNSNDLIDMIAQSSKRCCLTSAAVRKGEASTVVEKEKHCIIKKLHKHRSMTRINKHGGESSFDINVGLGCSMMDSASVPLRTNSIVRIHQSGLLETLTSSAVRKSTGKGSIPNFEKRVEEGSIAPKLQVKAKLPPEKTVADNLSSRNGCVKNIASVLGNSAQFGDMPQTSFEEQGQQYKDSANDEVARHCTQRTCEMRNRSKDTCCTDQVNDYRIDTLFLQGSACSSGSHEDIGHEIPEENSSITSNRIMSSQTGNVSEDREPYSSPVSTSSTISPVSPKSSNNNHYLEEPLPSSATAQVRLISSVEGDGRAHMQQQTSCEGTNQERKDQEVKTVASTKEMLVLSNDQPCCCSQKFSRQCFISGKQMPSNLCIRPMISSFGPCVNFGSDVVAGPVIDSPPGSISTMPSSDSTSKLAIFADFSSSTPIQSSSKPTLRLMGKNLTVAGKEDPKQLPNPVLDNPPTPKCLSPLRFASYNQHPPYHHQHQQQLLLGGSVVFSHHMPLHSYEMQICSFTRAPQLISVAKLDQQTARTRFNKKPHSFGTSHAPREVIVIDDMPDHEAAQRTSNAVSYTTSTPIVQASDLWMKVHGGLRPYFPAMQQVDTLQGYLHPTVVYSDTPQ